MKLDIKPGMIGLTGDDDFIGKAIRFFTGSLFSHSFCILHGPNSAIDILETTATKIHETTLEEKLVKCGWMSIWEPIADDSVKMEALEKTRDAYLGKWYGYLSYLWFFYRWVARKFGHEPKKIWGWASRGTTCTELVCHYLKELGGRFAEIFANLDLNTQSPQELLKIMEQNPDLFRFIGWEKDPPSNAKR